MAGVPKARIPLDPYVTYLTTNDWPFVNVKDFATGGAGTSADPWTGWDAAITWTPEITYRFGNGYYSLASSPAGWSQSRMTLIGDGGAVLKFTGAGVAFSMSSGPGIFGVTVRGIRVLGNASTTKGFYVSGVHHSKFEDIRVSDCSVAAFWQEWGVSNEWLNPRHTDNDRATVTGTYPTNGMYIGGIGGSASTATTVIDALFDNCVGSGIKLDKATTISLIGAVSETNGGNGLEITVNCDVVSIVDIHCEANTGEGISCDGGRVSFFGGFVIGLTATGRKVRFTANAINCAAFGAMFDTIQVDAGATNTAFSGVTFNLSGSGGFTDNGTRTAKLNVQTATGTVQPNVLVAQLTVPNVILTTVAPAAAAGQVALGSTTASTVGAAGGASALPATPLGYLIANVAGTQVKIAYWNN